MQAQGTESGPDSGASGLKEELTSDAKQLGNSAQRRVEEEAEKRKGGIASQAKSVGSALDRAASELDREDSPDWVRSLVRQTAGTVQNLADKLDNKSAGELTEEIRRFGRQQPAMFLAASAAAGFAAARLLRAGKAARDHEWTNSGSPRESYGGAQTGYSGAGSSMTGVTGVRGEYDPSAGISQTQTARKDEGGLR